MNKRASWLAGLTIIATGLAFADAPKIDSARLDAALKQIQAQMQSQAQPGMTMPNKAQLTQQVTQDLQTADVLKEEAIKAGLDKQPETQAAWQNLQSQFYASQYVNYLKSQIEVNDADLRKQYEATTSEINLLVIPFASKEAAEQGLEKLKKGLSFEALMKQQDPKAETQMWTNPQALPASVAQVVSIMNVGQITGNVVTFNGQSFLMKLAGSRHAEGAPSFEQMKAQLVDQAKNQKVQATIQQLLQERGINPAAAPAQ